MSTTIATAAMYTKEIEAEVIQGSMKELLLAPSWSGREREWRKNKIRKTRFLGHGVMLLRSSRVE